MITLTSKDYRYLAPIAEEFFGNSNLTYSSLLAESDDKLAKRALVEAMFVVEMDPVVGMQLSGKKLEDAENAKSLISTVIDKITSPFKAIYNWLMKKKSEITFTGVKDNMYDFFVEPFKAAWDKASKEEKSKAKRVWTFFKKLATGKKRLGPAMVIATAMCIILSIFSKKFREKVKSLLQFLKKIITLSKDKLISGIKWILSKIGIGGTEKVTTGGRRRKTA